MSAILEVWFMEVSKLREKVLLTKPKPKPKGEVEKEPGRQNMEINITTGPKDNSGGTMSEATVCLLMDRFVPW